MDIINNFRVRNGASLRQGSDSGHGEKCARCCKRILS